MTPTRAEAILRGQSALARKIYESVPIESAWTKNQILAEHTRVHGRAGVDVFQACLSQLKEAGIIKEPKPGSFQRSKISERVTTQQDAMAFADTSIKPVKKKETQMAIEKLGSIVDKAKKLASQFKEVAEELEELAISLDDETKKNAEAAQKLVQLQTLLKGLS